MVVLIVLCVLIALYALVSLFVFYLTFSRSPNLFWMPKPKDGEPLTPWDEYRDPIQKGLDWFHAQKVEDVYMTSRDGLKLRGRYLPCEGSDKAVLLAHGYRSVSPEQDFSGALELYHRMGFNVLLIDERAQFGSEGKYLTFGVMERLDVADWAAWLEGTYHQKTIILDGMSMGSATVLMALALPLPASVRGVIADCGFTTPEAILKHVMNDCYGMPAWLLMPGLKAAFRLITGHALSEASAPKALSGSSLPVLLFHGEADKFVPCDMGRENARASKFARLVTVPGAGHGMSFLVDNEKCLKALDNFMTNVIQ